MSGGIDLRGYDVVCDIAKIEVGFGVPGTWPRDNLSQKAGHVPDLRESRYE